MLRLGTTNPDSLLSLRFYPRDEDSIDLGVRVDSPAWHGPPGLSVHDHSELNYQHWDCDSSFALYSSTLGSEACNALGAPDEVIHSNFSLADGVLPSSMEFVGDSLVVPASVTLSAAKHKDVLNHPWDTELQRRAGKCEISIGTQGLLSTEPHSLLCSASADLLDDVSVHSFSVEQLAHSGIEAPALQDLGREIPHHEEVSSTLLPPSVDWAGILGTQGCPWLREINRDYVEVSFVFQA